MSSPASKPTFATCINCIDGRAQAPAAAYIKKRFGVDYVDMITEPGVNKILAESGSRATVASIKEKVQLSLQRQCSRVIAIVAHHGCLGNPVSKSIHIKQIRKAVHHVRGWELDAEVLGIWVNEEFRAEKIPEI